MMNDGDFLPFPFAADNLEDPSPLAAERGPFHGRFFAHFALPCPLEGSEFLFLFLLFPFGGIVEKDTR